MGKRGPPKKPTAQKKREGTYRKDRAPKNEAEPPVCAPPKPSYLNRDASEFWDYMAPRLVRDRLLTDIDLAQFTNWCEVEGEIRYCKRNLRKHGRVFTTKSGMVHVRPEVKMLTELRKQSAEYARRFGCDAASRSETGALPGPHDRQADEEFLFGGAEGLKVI